MGAKIQSRRSNGLAVRVLADRQPDTHMGLIILPLYLPLMSEVISLMCAIDHLLLLFPSNIVAFHFRSPGLMH